VSAAHRLSVALLVACALLSLARPSLAQRSRAQPTPAQLEALRTVESEVAAFAQRAEGYRRSLERALEGAHERDLAAVRQQFERQIAAERSLEARARSRAIAVFERFVHDHPSEEQHTPDVLLRLAELYFDEARWQRLEADEALDRARSERERAGLSTDDLRAPPPPDYRCSILAYRHIVGRFAGYSRRDAALYLLGWVLRELGREPESLAAYRALVCPSRVTYAPQLDLTRPLVEGDRAPLRCAALARTLREHGAHWLTGGRETASSNLDPTLYSQCVSLSGADGQRSRYTAEVWYALGDQHFDDGGDVDRNAVSAVAAYTQSVRASEASAPAQRGPFWQRAQYKLAWSHFRMQRGYAQALAAFSTLLDHLSAVADPASQGMRSDAIRWIGVILSESEWNAPLADPERQLCQPVVERVAQPTPDAVRPFDCAGVLRVQSAIAQDRPWTADAWLELASDYAQQTKHYEAIAVYRLFLRSFAAHPQAPLALSRIAECQRRLGLRAQANATSEQFRAFAEGSAWATANAGDHRALAAAERLSRDAVRTAALDEHQRARALRLRADPAASMAYGSAAEMYRAYIERFSDSEDGDELSFNRADALFWQGRYAEAAAQYERVRERTDGSRFVASAAYMSTVARARLVLAARERGAITECDARYAGVEDARGASCSFVAGAASPRMDATITALLAARAAYARVVSRADDSRAGLSEVVFEREGLGHAPPFRAVFAYRSAVASLWFGQVAEGERALRAIVESGCESPFDVRAMAVAALADSLQRRGDNSSREALLQRLDRDERACPASVAPTSSAQSEVALRLGRQAFERSQYAEAARLFARAARATGPTPVRFIATYLQALSLERSSMPERAAELHEQNLRALDALGSHAFAALGVEDREELRAVAIHTVLALADARRRALDDDAALALYERALREPPSARVDDGERVRASLVAIATIHGHRHEWERAARAWEQYATQAADARVRAEALYRSSEARARAGEGARAIVEWRAFRSRVAVDRESIEWHLRAQRAIVDALTASRDARGAERERSALVALYRGSSQPAATMAAAIVAEALVAPLSARVEAVEREPLREATAESLAEQLRARARALTSIDEDARAIVALRAAEPSVAALEAGGRAHEWLATQLARVGALVRLSPAQERSLAAVEAQSARLDRLATQLEARDRAQAERLRAQAEAIRERVRGQRESVLSALQARFDREAEAERVLAVQGFVAAAHFARSRQLHTGPSLRALDRLRSEENRALLDRAVQSMDASLRGALSLDERAARALIAVESAGQTALASDQSATPGLAAER
jgi:TolA-binding protein